MVPIKEPPSYKVYVANRVRLPFNFSLRRIMHRKRTFRWLFASLKTKWLERCLGRRSNQYEIVLWPCPQSGPDQRTNTSKLIFQEVKLRLVPGIPLPSHKILSNCIPWNHSCQFQGMLDRRSSWNCVYYTGTQRCEILPWGVLTSGLQERKRGTKLQLSCQFAPALSSIVRYQSMIDISLITQGLNPLRYTIQVDNISQREWQRVVAIFYLGTSNAIGF